jgi:hypothetical protein
MKFPDPRDSQSFDLLVEPGVPGYDLVGILRLLKHSYPSGKTDEPSKLTTVIFDGY